MKAPSGTQGLARILLPADPKSIRAADLKNQSVDLTPQWDAKTKTLLIKYPNHPDGVQVTLEF